MNIKSLKLKPLDKLSQVILFEQNGSILESDETLVKVLSNTYNVFEDTFLSGMDDKLDSLDVDEMISLDCIETSFFGRDAQYDFVVQKVSEDPEVTYALLIYDHSKQYQRIFELQQERNMAEMKIMRLERKNQKLQDEKELLDKLYSEQINDGSKYVLVKSDNLHVNVDLNEVLYFEAYGDYIKIHTIGKTYVTHSTMKSVEEKLPKSNFFRIHRSFIIALNKITNIEQMSVLIGEKVLPMGKSYKSLLLEKIKHI